MLERYLPSKRDTWTWHLADLKDVVDIVNMAESMFQTEIESVFTPDRRMLTKYLAQAIIAQTYNPLEKQIIVARHNATDVLAAWAWLSRGGYTMYAPEEFAEAHFAHIDLKLSARSRVTIMAQILQQWHMWCLTGNIPVLVSTSIREDQAGFMHLHHQGGFVIRGSFAYLRVSQ